jgi:hypothetical protein
VHGFVHLGDIDDGVRFCPTCRQPVFMTRSKQKERPQHHQTRFEQPSPPFES